MDLKVWFVCVQFERKKLYFTANNNFGGFSFLVCISVYVFVQRKGELEFMLLFFNKKIVIIT